MGTDEGQANPPAPAAGDPLQFDQVELASPEAARLCARCQRQIDDEYFEFAGRVVCRACATELGGGAGGNGAFLRAAAFGGAAALVGTIVWYAIVKITNYELGLIAVGVGLLVGVAVQKGSRGRGGWKYQALAMVLTYMSITASKLPFIVSAIRERAAAGDTEPGERAKDKESSKESNKESPTAVGKVANRPADTGAAKPSGDETDDARPRVAGPTTEKDSPGLGALIVAFAFLLGIALASPFLGGAGNIMGIIIIGIALYEAWKINRRAPVSGPYRIGAAATATAATDSADAAPNPTAAP